jgi:exonuclease VII small subunit
MGLLDDLKKKLPELQGSVEKLAEEHDDEIKDGLDQAASFVDEKTGGKHRDTIDQGLAKAKDTVDDLAKSKAPETKPKKRRFRLRKQR